VTLYLTYCETCTQNTPDFLAVVNQLQREHPDDLCVVELACIAACDAAPAVMIDLIEEDAEDAFDYVPRISASQLYRQINNLF
jgi:hypothetical protein